ncbi:MAG: hypothetical protein HYV65_03750 [Candidatus Spechtbacteria bacterium]|nr:hypothetical protein [Candidatus Spechtbacteria bacterium]
MTMPISIIPKKKPESPSGLAAIFAIIQQNLFLIFGVIALLIIGSAYGVLYSLSQNDQKKLDDAKNAYLQLVSPETIKQNIDAREFAGRANQLQSLLDSHHQPSRIFPLIESSLHPLVVLDELSFEYSSSQIKARGNTDSYKILAEQLVLWNATKNITSVHLENFQLGTDGRLVFSVTLKTDPLFTIPKK